MNDLPRWKNPVFQHPKFMKPNEMAEFLGVSKGTLYNWRRMGMPSYRLAGKLVRYSPTEVIQWIRETQPDQALEDEEGWK